MAITPAVESFLTSRIDSVEELEILLLTRIGGAWNADTAGERLGIDREVARVKLESLTAARLLAREGEAYRYAPQDEEIPKIVAELVREYSERRANVINLIYSASLDKLRKFAEAFRLRRK